MQMVKKLLALILALVLVVSVAACGAEKAPDTKTSDATTAAGTKAEEPKPQELPFVTVTHHVMGDPPTNGAGKVERENEGKNQCTHGIEMDRVGRLVHQVQSAAGFRRTY
jgi:hypothetical protein